MRCPHEGVQEQCHDANELIAVMPARDPQPSLALQARWNHKSQELARWIVLQRDDVVTCRCLFMTRTDRERTARRCSVLVLSWVGLVTVSWPPDSTLLQPGRLVRRVTGRCAVLVGPFPRETAPCFLWQHNTCWTTLFSPSIFLCPARFSLFKCLRSVGRLAWNVR